MNALPPEDLRADYEDFARPSHSVKEAGWRLYARKLIERIAALTQERDHEQTLREEWRAATLAEQSKVTQLVVEKAVLISDRDQLRAKLALLTDPAEPEDR